MNIKSKKIAGSRISSSVIDEEGQSEGEEEICLSLDEESVQADGDVEGNGGEGSALNIESPEEEPLKIIKKKQTNGN